jgi:hypothetical protein
MTNRCEFAETPPVNVRPKRFKVRFLFIKLTWATSVSVAALISVKLRRNLNFRATESNLAQRKAA